MKDLCFKHDNSPFMHYAMGAVFAKIALDTNEPNARQTHSKNATESGRKSVTLSPNSVKFSLFYASSLLEIEKEWKGLQEAVQECQRALAIENTTDPAKETLREGSLQKISTAEARVAYVKNELLSLIQKIIHLTRVLENTIELGQIQGIKKAFKSTEERRKEIELSVTAARLLQQKSESLQDGIVRISLGTLKIRISYLKTHFREEESVIEILIEALSFKKENEEWKFWPCCCCIKKFAEVDSYWNHCNQEHLENLLPTLQSVIPYRVENEWVGILRNCSWKPMDLNAAITMLEERSNFDVPNFIDKKHPRNVKDDILHNKDLKISLLHKSRPSTDDTDRVKLLERIHTSFEWLINCNYLPSSHVSNVIHFVVKALSDGSHLLNYSTDQTLLCICFLDHVALQKIDLLFQEILRDCSSCKDKYFDKSCTQVVDIMEKIILTSDDLLLALDEAFRACKHNSSSRCGLE